jgi:hypothetical protein
LKSFLINKLNVQLFDNMADYAKFYWYQGVHNDPNLSQEIKNILLTCFSTYSMDVGEGFLEFKTMSELQQCRDVGLDVFIVSIDGRKVRLTLDQEMTIMELELSHEDDGDHDSVPELISFNQYEVAYLEALNSGDKIAQREAALEWIQDMDAYDFQVRLKENILPDFERDTENHIPLERSCEAPCRLMTDDELNNEEFNQGYLKRHLLRYISLENFKETYYQEFIQKKLSMEETMRQIELETEAKVIEGYKSGDIQLLPIMLGNAEPNIVNAQTNFLKNIMEEGAKKFEAAAGRPMSYSEMRQMYG